MRPMICIAAAAAIGLAVAACGETTSERAITGGALGAGVGAAGAAAAGGSPLTGALIGGAGGAATGALTNPDQLDLGEPIWDR